MAQPNSQPETFSNVQPIPQETFSNVAPIEGSPPSQSFLQRAATQPSKFSQGNPLRYLDELGQGMAGGIESLIHPVDTAKKMYQAFTDKSPTPDLSPGQFADLVFQSYGQSIPLAGVTKGLGKVGETIEAGQYKIANASKPPQIMGPRIPEYLRSQAQGTPVPSVFERSQAPVNMRTTYPSGGKPSRPAPAWQSAPEQGTEIKIQGSTPEEIKAQLQKLAARKANVPRGTSSVNTQAETPQFQQLPPPQAKPIQPPFPGPQEYTVTRGTDPFTHPKAPKSWRFDQDYSTNVKQYGYDPDSQTLSVMYKRGSVYQFKATQQQFAAMQKAPSAGTYLRDVIEPSQSRGVGTHIGTVAPKLTPGAMAKQALGGSLSNQ